MLGQRIGYVRVSTLEQNPERQLEAEAPWAQSPIPSIALWTMLALWFGYGIPSRGRAGDA